MPSGDDGTEPHRPSARTFPATKFGPPQVPPDSVERSALVGRIEAELARHPLVLLAAPAGTGKTTVLAQWAAGTRMRTFWLRLTSNDDDLETLAAALHLTLTRGGVASPYLEHALNSGVTSPRGYAAAAVNDLIGTTDSVIVVDDLHILRSGDSLTFLSLLLDFLPEGVALLAAGREVPNALGVPLRLARGSCSLFEFTDLRLSVAEVGELARRNGNDAVEADELAERTGGWAAAVRLALTSSHRRWDGLQAAATHDFFVSEVLSHFDDRLQHFLRRSSVLEVLDPESCATVTGFEEAASMLDRLVRGGMLMSAERGREWRLHDLVRDRLYELLRTDPEEDLAALHARAAEVTPLGESIRHLVLARQPEVAAELITKAWLEGEARGEVIIPHSWLELIPPSVCREHPGLRLVDATLATRAGRAHEARGDLPQIIAAFEEGPERALTAARLAYGEASLATGDFATTSEVLNSMSHETELAPRHQALVVAGRLWLSYYAGRWDDVCGRLLQLVQIARSATDRAAAEAVALALSPALLFADQGPAWIRRQVEWLRHSGMVAAGSAADTALLTMLAAEHLRTGSFESARDQVATCRRASSKFGGLAWVDPSLDVLELGLSAVEHPVRARQTATRIAGEVDGAPARRRMFPVIALFHDMCSREGAERARLHHRIDSHHGDPLAQVASVILEARQRAQRGRLSEASRLLEGATSLQARSRNWLGGFHVDLELAHLRLRQDRLDDALASFAPILEKTAADGSLGLMLIDTHVTVPLVEVALDAGIEQEFCREVLAVGSEAAKPRPQLIPGSPERLTSREVEVLREVAAGSSNRDVAAALFISERTVKTHMSAVLRKLEARSRTEAVARARSLGLAI